MAQISYEDFQTSKEEREVRNSSLRVPFFYLKNDQDEALVRFMHNSPQDFDIMYVHTAVVNGKRRKVNCIRDPRSSISDCPLCESGSKLQTNIYIHLVEYTRDETGAIVATPKIWERTSSYITTLKNLCDEYPPLSDNLFKIKRNGAAGSVDTTYSIMYASPAIYKSDMYQKDEHCFDNIKALGSCVLDMNYDSLVNLTQDSNDQSSQVKSASQVFGSVEPSKPVMSNPVNTPVEMQPQESTTFVSRSYNPGSVHMAADNADFIRPRRLD